MISDFITNMTLLQYLGIAVLTFLSTMLIGYELHFSRVFRNELYDDLNFWNIILTAFFSLIWIVTIPIFFIVVLIFNATKLFK
jgi:small basic protein